MDLQRKNDGYWEMIYVIFKNYGDIAFFKMGSAPTLAQQPINHPLQQFVALKKPIGRWATA